MAPIFVNSAKLNEIPSRFRAPAAITHAALLKGVVAPPRFVPNTSADHAAGEFISIPFIIGAKVKAIAMLLTMVLARPLNHRAVSYTHLTLPTKRIV